jgi:hypothetical protein
MMNHCARKWLLLSFFAVGFTSISQAQNDLQKAVNAATITKDPKDTTKMTWKTGGLINLTFNQTALSNWSAGGDKSALAFNGLVNLYGYYLDGRRSWDNFLLVGYGIANTTSLGTRKTDDRFNITSKYGYDLGHKWYLTGLLDFRTQFSPGYNYPSENKQVLTSDFLAPAYLLLSLGMDYKPTDNFSVFLSPATVRELIVDNDSLAAHGAFGVDSGQKSRFEFGAYVSVNYLAHIGATSTYVGRLDLFSDYLNNPQNIAVYMTNVLNVKMTTLLSMNLSVTLIYDDRIHSVNADGTFGGPRLQLQEVLGVGLAYKFAKKKRAGAPPVKVTQ